MTCVRCYQDDPAAMWETQKQLSQAAELVDESHFHITLRTCGPCGQHWASVFCERVDFANGNDPQDWLRIPLSPDEAMALQTADAETYLRQLPARRYLVRWFAADAESPICLQRDGLIIFPPHD